MENCVAPGLDEFDVIIRSCIVFSQSNREREIRNCELFWKWQMCHLAIIVWGSGRLEEGVGGCQFLYDAVEKVLFKITTDSLATFYPKNRFILFSISILIFKNNKKLRLMSGIRVFAQNYFIS